MIYRNSNNNCGNVNPDTQFHVHEVLGSTEIAGATPHNNRFVTVSNEARFIGNNHVHDVWFRTDFAVNDSATIQQYQGAALAAP